MNQYPHKLYYKTIAPTKDANGNWSNPSEGEWIQASAGDEKDCREEPEDGGRGVVVVDGVKVEFTSMIYARRSIATLKRGDKVKVEDGAGNVRIESTVKRFSREFFHSVIWV